MSAAAMKDLVARYPNSARGHVDVHAIEAAKESHKRIDIVRREHPADLQIAQAGSIDNNGFRGVAVEFTRDLGERLLLERDLASHP